AVLEAAAVDPEEHGQLAATLLRAEDVDGEAVLVLRARAVAAGKLRAAVAVGDRGAHAVPARRRLRRGPAKRAAGPSGVRDAEELVGALGREAAHDALLGASDWAGLAASLVAACRRGQRRHRRECARERRARRASTDRLLDHAPVSLSRGCCPRRE